MRSLDPSGANDVADAVDPPGAIEVANAVDPPRAIDVADTTAPPEATDAPDPADAADVCVVLLAAGASRRMGRAKQRIRIEGEAMVCRAARAALGASARLVVVTGAHGGAVAAELAGIPHQRVKHMRWAEGLGSSIARGVAQVQRIEPAPTALVVALADQPLVDARAIARLIEAHRRAPDAIVAAAYGGTLGPPSLFPRRDWSELAELAGDRGARTLLDRHAARVVRVDLPEAAIDIDTPDDLRQLEQKLEGGDRAATAWREGFRPGIRTGARPEPDRESKGIAPD